MRLLAGLPYVAHPNRRYWAHLTFVCTHLLSTVLVFWIFWSYRDVAWTFPRFVLVLAGPALVYFNACTLVPENASAIESWQNYYYSVRRRYFIGLLCWVAVVAASTTLVLSMPWTHPARLSQAAYLIMSIVGAVSTSPPRAHGPRVIRDRRGPRCGVHPGSGSRFVSP
jgi:hypothetical protein